MLAKSELISSLNEVFGQTARLRKGGNELVYFCPFCHHRKKKLEICIDENSRYFGVFDCWTCRTSGTLWKLLSLLNVPYDSCQAIFKLTGEIRLSWSQNTVPEAVEIQLPLEYKPLSVPKTTPEYKNALAYLKRRGITWEDVLRYNIGYCEADCEYKHHLIFPSYNQEGHLNFFIGRRYYDIPGAFSYKKPECSTNLVGFECFLNFKEPLSLCEGVFDAISIRNNAVPLFGKYPSRKLCEALLIHGTPRVNMILDNDAKDAAVRNCEMLMRLGINVYLVELEGKDPSALGFEKVHRCIRNAQPFTDDDLLKHALGL